MSLLLLNAVLLGALGLRRVFAGYPPTGSLAILHRGEAAFLRASGDAMFPAGGPVPPSASDTGIDRYVDAYLAVVPGRMRRLMRMLFFAMEHATLLAPAPAPRGRRRFSALSPTQRAAVLDAFMRSDWFPRRLAFTSLRAVLTNGYLSDPRVLAPLSLLPFEIDTPVREADLLYPRVGAPRSSVRYRPGDLSPARPAPPLAPDSPRRRSPEAER